MAHTNPLPDDTVELFRDRLARMKGRTDIQFLAVTRTACSVRRYHRLAAAQRRSRRGRRLIGAPLVAARNVLLRRLHGREPRAR